MSTVHHLSTYPQTTVCHLLHGLWVGGAEVLASRLARGLQDSFRFLFVCLDELGTLGRELQREGFPVVVLGRKPRVDWFCSWRLSRLLRKERVDLIHAHQYTPFFYALTARLLYRRPPILFTEHGRHFPDFPRPKRKLANRLLLQQRDRVVGVGQAVRQALIQNEGLPGQRIEVIYNGINLGTPKNPEGERCRVRQELGLKKNELVVLQVARLDPIKDHGTALRSFARLANRCPEARLLIVGEGPQEETIRAQVRQLHLESQVLLLGLRTDIPSLLAAADLFLLTSVSEGIPLTIIEAMTAELPVVATKVGGLPEIIEDGKNGFLVPAKDDATLAEKILLLATNPSRRKDMGQAGAHLARRMFSEPAMKTAYLNLYQQMLAEKLN